MYRCTSWKSCPPPRDSGWGASASSVFGGGFIESLQAEISNLRSDARAVCDEIQDEVERSF